MESTNAPIHRQVEAALADHGVRYTSGRKAVVTALCDADGPLSVAELTDQMGNAVPTSSVYRTIAVFEEAGVVSHHLATREMARYELAEWLRGHHHHLVCIDCGRVDDIEVDDHLEQDVERVVDLIASGTSFKPTNHALEIEGRCGACA